MDDALHTPSTAEIAQTAMKLVSLTQRAIAVGTRIQGRNLDQVSGAEYSLMDSSTLAKAYMNVWSKFVQNPQKMWDAQLKVGEAMTRSWLSFLDQSGDQDSKSKGDRRFADATWSEDPASKFYRDSYLMFEGTVGTLLDQLEKGSRDELRVKFYTRQMLSALSPSNFLATNAAAQKQVVETRGQSLLEGRENLLDDLERGEGRLDIATNDGKAFVVGRDLAATEGGVVFQNELIQLIQYHLRTDKQHSTPILFVPAWINKFYILDMRPQNSLIRYMLDRGHSVFVISWVNPTKQHADLDFSDYMKLGPLSALDAIRDITKQDKANILGFCIGGILVTATLGYLTATVDDRIQSATTLATMVDFKDVGETGVFIDENRLKVLRAHMAEKGYLENYHLQDMFSMLRENDLIWSFYESNYLRGNKPRPFDLLFWNSASTRLPAAMLIWYLKEVYLENKLRLPGGLSLNGVDIDLSKIETPFYVLATIDDHIAPWRSVYPTTGILGGDVEFVLGGSGHIAGVINPPNPNRHKYAYRTANSYPASADDFLAQAEQHEASWWPHWANWLEAMDDKMVPARNPAKRGKYQSIEPAPGSYVSAISTD